MSEFCLGVMELQEAKNHQLKLKSEGIELTLKVNDHTCTSGCKVTVEVWALEDHNEAIAQYFKRDYFKHVKGHEPDLIALNQVFDPSAAEVICQACGTAFSPSQNVCPDCGLVY